MLPAYLSSRKHCIRQTGNGGQLSCASVAVKGIHPHILSAEGRSMGTSIADSEVPPCDFSGAEPDLQSEAAIITAALKGSLSDCRLAHAYVVEAGLLGDVYLVNLILRAYSKLGIMVDARDVFDRMPRPSTLSWNTIIAGYTNSNAKDEGLALFNKMPQRDTVSWNTIITAKNREGKSHEVLHLFYRSCQEAVLPNAATFVNVLSACSKLENLRTGQFIHVLICGCGFDSSLIVGTTLISMYAKLNDLQSANSAFHKLCEQDVASWTSLISAHAQLGKSDVALCLHQQMLQEGIQPNTLTIQSILCACANELLIKEGMAIHACVCSESIAVDVDIDIECSLINMYSKCGSLGHAWFVFKHAKSTATGIWNAMIAACVEQACYLQALSFFTQKIQKGIGLDKVTFVNIMNVCASLMICSMGSLVHAHLIEEGHDLDIVVNNAILTFYTRCRALEDAVAVFKGIWSHNVVSWTCMIAAYGQEGFNRQALDLFQQMQVQQVRPNDITVATVLASCADSMSLEDGRTIHTWITFERSQLTPVLSSGILNMYGKTGAVADALSAFKGLADINTVASWNAMINGFAYEGQIKAIAACYFRMQAAGVQPDKVTFVGMLSACSHAGMIEEGIHYFMLVLYHFYTWFLPEHCICIIDLFGRAGQIARARGMVCQVPVLPDMCLWSAMEAGSRIHGDRICGYWALEHILEVC